MGSISSLRVEIHNAGINHGLSENGIEKMGCGERASLPMARCLKDEETSVGLSGPAEQSAIERACSRKPNRRQPRAQHNWN